MTGQSADQASSSDRIEVEIIKGQEPAPAPADPAPVEKG